MGSASEWRLSGAAEEQNRAAFLFVRWRIAGGVGAAGLGGRPETLTHIPARGSRDAAGSHALACTGDPELLPCRGGTAKPPPARWTLSLSWGGGA